MNVIEVPRVPNAQSPQVEVDRSAVEPALLLGAALRGRTPARGLGSYIHEQFAAIGGADLDTSRSDEPARAVDFRA